MPKYNVYKVLDEHKSSLVEHLKEKGLCEGKEKESESGWKMEFFYSKEPSETEVKWKNLYKEFIPSEQELLNKTHFGAMILSKGNKCYLVSLGKTSFYLRDFINSDFALEIGERIIDFSKDVPLKNSKLFGGRKRKTIDSFLKNTPLVVESGESISYVKGKTKNEEKWGKSVECGNSVKFSLDKRSPDDLPSLIEDIEEIQTEESSYNIPRCEKVNDKEEIDRLDQTLVRMLNCEILEFDFSLFEVFGVDFIFPDYEKIELIYKKKKYKFDDIFSLQDLQNHLKDNNEEINLDFIQNAKIKFYQNDEARYSEKLRNYIDFIDDESHCLIIGEWYKFNQTYFQHLRRSVDEIAFIHRNDLDYRQSEYEEWKNLPEHANENINYSEVFMIDKLKEQSGGEVYDRKNVKKGGYTVEYFDLLDENSEAIYFVKIGTPQKLGYVIDQACNTIQLARNNGGFIEIEGKKIKPKTICLWLITNERKTPIENVSEIKSLIFLMKLDHWKKLTLDSGLKPSILISYKLKETRGDESVDRIAS